MSDRTRSTVRLPGRLALQLGHVLETGMGFQVVDLVLADGRVLAGVVVLNAELAEIPDSAGSVDPAAILDLRPTSGALGPNDSPSRAG